MENTMNKVIDLLDYSKINMDYLDGNITLDEVVDNSKEDMSDFYF